MIVEEITWGNERLFVGLAEIKNSKHMSREQLVAFASEHSRGLMALQFVDAASVAGVIHLLSAAQNAVNAWKGGYPIARGLDVEVLVYASAQRQIGKAFERMGVRDGLDHVAVVVISDKAESAQQSIGKIVKRMGPERDPPFPLDQERTERVMSLFDIDKAELGAISDGERPEDVQNALSRCVAGRVSLVAVDS